MQLTLSLDEPRARSRDPITSKLAAAAAKDLQRAHCDEIVRALQKFGPMGKTGIASRCRLTDVQVARRTGDLQRAGLIKLTGQTSMSAAGRPEQQWMVR